MALRLWSLVLHPMCSKTAVLSETMPSDGGMIWLAIFVNVPRDSHRVVDTE